MGRHGGSIPGIHHPRGPPLSHPARRLAELCRLGRVRGASAPAQLRASQRAPLKDPILGLDFLLQGLAAVKTHHVLDFYNDAFQRFGSGTFMIKVLGRNVVMTKDPENLKAVLSKSFEDFPVGGIRLDAVAPVLGKASIFSSNGEEWHKARAFIRPSFVRNQVADLAVFDRHVENMVALFPADGETFDLKRLLQLMTMDVSTDFMLGYSTNLLKEVSPEAQQFLDDFDSSSIECATRARLGPILLKLPAPKIKATARRMREFLGFYLRKAFAERSDTKDREYVFLNALLDSGASEGYIIDQILSVIIAGRDTTSSTMTSCFWYLARSPETVAKLRAEIQELPTEDPSWEQLKNMKYLNNIVREGRSRSLFFSPPIAPHLLQNSPPWQSCYGGLLQTLILLAPIVALRLASPIATNSGWLLGIPSCREAEDPTGSSQFSSPGNAGPLVQLQRAQEQGDLRP